MKISIIHPTRNRKQQALATVHKWLDRADHVKEIEYLLSIDNDDSDTYSNCLTFFGYTSKEKDIFPVRNDNKSAIEAINNAAKIASGDVFIVVSDDTDCFQGWDTALKIMCYSRIDFCAKTDDGLQPTLITMPLMDRVYYERYGYIYHPDYLHMFCDQELTSVAIMTGKYIKLPLLFEHLHYTTGKSQRDALNYKNDSTWIQGETLFNERLKTNFGIENPVIPYSDIVWR